MAIFSGWGGWSGNKDNNGSIYIMINLKFTPHWHIQHAWDDSLALLKYLMSDKSFFLSNPLINKSADGSLTYMHMRKVRENS